MKLPLFHSLVNTEPNAPIAALASTRVYVNNAGMQNSAESVSPLKINPTVYRLGLVSFFADVSSEMLYPVTPIFLTLVLGASVAHVGIIEGVAEGIASLLKAYSGRWSDRLKERRTFVWVGYLCAALAKPLTGVATSWTHVLAARSLDRLGKGIRTAPRDALLSEAVAENERGVSFGWHRMMDSLGATLGPLIAIAFLHFFSEPRQMRTLYYLAVLPGLASVALVFTVKEKHRAPSRDPKQFPWRDSLTPRFRQYLLAWSVFSLVNSSDVFLILRAQKAGLTLTTTILLYTFYNLFYALLSPYLGFLSDRWGRKRVLSLGLFVFAAVYSGFGFASQAWQFWILFAVYGVYMAATDGVGKALAVDLVPKELKATGLGVLGTVTGVATILASTVAGFLWDRFGMQWTFFYGAMGALAAILILSRLSEAARESAKSV